MRTPSPSMSLVDVLIATTILGMLAAVAVPQMRRDEAPPHHVQVSEALDVLRGAVERYWAEHEDGFPGRDGADALLDALRRTSSPRGRIGNGAGFTCGPYLPTDRFPRNPLTGTDTVRVVSTMPGRPEGDEAWIYDSSSGVVRCNVRGSDPQGVRWFDY